MTALMGLDARLRLAKLYLVTDARRREGDLADFLRAAVAGGVDIVRVREQGLAPEAELEVLELARTAALPHQVIVAASSAALAGRLRADMLHLDQADEPSAAARAQLHPWALLGRTAHSTAEIDAAVADPETDYLTVGPVRASSLDPAYPPVGLDPLRHAARVAPTFAISSKPVFAVGGIGPDTLDAVLEAGARRVAVTSALTRVDDPQAAAAQLKRRLQDAWNADPASERYTLQALAGAGARR